MRRRDHGPPRHQGRRARSRRAAWILAALSASLTACASIPERAPAAVPAAPAAGQAAPAAGLPQGAGRTILQTQCTWCHDLREVTKFRGYYDRRQWRDIVVTMVEYGAAVKPGDVEVLADYLTEHLGKKEE